MAWEWVGVAIALGLAAEGCGGRTELATIGSEPGWHPAESGGETPVTEPPASKPPASEPPASEPSPLAECGMTRRTDAHFDGAVGSLSQDGSLLTLLGNTVAPLQVFRPSDDSVLSGFEVPATHHYYRATVSTDNTLVAAAGDAVTLFRVADGAVLADVVVSGPGQDGWAAQALDFSHNGRLLVTADGRERAANIWSVPDLRLVSSIPLQENGEGRPTSAVAFSPDDSRVITVNANVVSLWNVADTTQVWSQPMTACYNIGDVRFSPDGAQLVEACLMGSNSVLSSADGRVTSALGTASFGVGSVSYYDDDHILIGDDGVGARIWARDAAGAWSPSCLLRKEVPQWGPVAASAGGSLMYLHVNGGPEAAWLFAAAGTAPLH